jgi:hypothetical protein
MVGQVANEGLKNCSTTFMSSAESVISQFNSHPDFLHTFESIHCFEVERIDGEKLKENTFIGKNFIQNRDYQGTNIFNFIRTKNFIVKATRLNFNMSPLPLISIEVSNLDCYLFYLVSIRIRIV